MHRSIDGLANCGTSSLTGCGQRPRPVRRAHQAECDLFAGPDRQEAWWKPIRVCPGADLEQDHYFSIFNQLAALSTVGLGRRSCIRQPLVDSAGLFAYLLGGRRARGICGRANIDRARTFAPTGCRRRVWLPDTNNSSSNNNNNNNSNNRLFAPKTSAGIRLVALLGRALWGSSRVEGDNKSGG